MKRCKSLVAMVVIAFTTFHSTMYAGIQQVVRSGQCEQTTGNWITVVNIDSDTGRIIGMWGTNCKGESWVGHCSIMEVPGNPGVTSSFIDYGTNYWVRYNVNQYGVVTSAWGYDAGSQYWQFDLPILQ
ncbi:MAG: hypothetical protein ABIR47_06085 [Candidatus Kapaibacterium sp.]